MIDLRCHAVEHCQTRPVATLACQFQPTQHIPLCLLGLIGTQIDGGQRVERRTDAVDVATGLVQTVALQGILRRLLVVGQADAVHRQQVEAVGLDAAVVAGMAQRQSLLTIVHHLVILLLGIVVLGCPVPHLLSQRVERCSVSYLHLPAGDALLLQQCEVAVGHSGTGSLLKLPQRILNRTGRHSQRQD